MGGFAVHSVAQRAVGFLVNIYVQEGEVALHFGLHGELNALVMLFRWFRRSFSLSGLCSKVVKVLSS
jgi:hypothetical protein